MLKKLLDEALQLTSDIMTTYWQGDLSILIPHMDKDIMWIGSCNQEYMYGAEMMLTYIRKNLKEAPPVYLDGCEYKVVEQDARSCVVVGRYRAYTKPDSGCVLSEKQRVTFVWKNTDEGLKIVHLHLSNTLHIQDEDEHFPTKAGKETYEYMQGLLENTSHNDVIPIKDVNGVINMIHFREIVYLESKRNYLLLHKAGTDTAIEFRDTLDHFSNKLPPEFARVRRNIVANLTYAKSLDGMVLHLVDGSHFIVPITKRAKIKKSLNRR